MVNYGNGKIYKITGSNLIYYGSTTQPLNKRKEQHKKKECSSKIIIEKGDWEIVLVENYSCENKEQLFSRERWWIENNECVNKHRPIRTAEEKEEQKKNAKKQFENNNKEHIKQYEKQYNIDNKEHKKEYNIQYRIDNKEKNKEYTKQYRIDNKEKINEKQRERRKLKKLNPILLEAGL